MKVRATKDISMHNELCVDYFADALKDPPLLVEYKRKNKNTRKKVISTKDIKSTAVHRSWISTWTLRNQGSYENTVWCDQEGSKSCGAPMCDRYFTTEIFSTTK